MNQADRTHLLVTDLVDGTKRLVTLADYLLGYVGENQLRLRSLLSGERMLSGCVRIERVDCPCTETGSEDGCERCEGDLYVLGCDDCGDHVSQPGCCECCVERRELDADAAIREVA